MGNENEKPIAKKKKRSKAPTTPARKVHKKKARKPLGNLQPSNGTDDATNQDFELGSPARGASPDHTDAVGSSLPSDSVPVLPKSMDTVPDLDVSLGGLTSGDSEDSRLLEDATLSNAMEKVSEV